MTGRVMNSEFRIMNKQLNATLRNQYEVPLLLSPSFGGVGETWG